MRNTVGSPVVADILTGEGWRTEDGGPLTARGTGWIVNVSSVAGLVSAVGFGYYSATKFAIEAVTDALRDEVAAQGISVLTVEPGAFRTNAYAGFADEPVSEPISEYHDMLKQVQATFVQMDGAQPGD